MEKLVNLFFRTLTSLVNSAGVFFLCMFLELHLSYGLEMKNLLLAGQFWGNEAAIVPTVMFLLTLGGVYTPILAIYNNQFRFCSSDKRIQDALGWKTTICALGPLLGFVLGWGLGIPTEVLYCTSALAGMVGAFVYLSFEADFIHGKQLRQAAAERRRREAAAAAQIRPAQPEVTQQPAITPSLELTRQNPDNRASAFAVQDNNIENALRHNRPLSSP
jgi:hypothetical protein